MDILISNVTAVTMNEKMEVLFGAYIGIENGKIISISKTAPSQQPGKIVDGTGMVAIPGLVNCHSQLATTALRSLLDDLSRPEAIEQQLKKEAKMDSRAAKAAVKLALAECLRFGVTSVSDLYYYPAATAEAIAETGMKGNIALSAYRYIDALEEFDFETDEQCQELVKVVDRWNGHDNGRIHIDAGIHSEYTSNHKLWEALAVYAQEAGIGMQLQLAQTRSEAESCLDRTGLSQAELLDCHRLFSVPTTAAGCASLSDEDKQLLGKRKITAVCTPIAQAKAGESAMDILGCVKAGMNVTLGTGSTMDAGSLDLFEVMRAAALGIRQSSSKADALPAPAVLMLATVCGARAQGRGDECGMLKVGMDADIALVDFSAPHLLPCHNVLNALVYSAKGGDVAMTMVRGQILYQNGQFPTIDLNEAVRELTEYAIPRLFDDGKK